MRNFKYLSVIILSILFASCEQNTESSKLTRKGYSGEELIGDIVSVTISHCTLEEKFGEECIGRLKIEEKYIFNNIGNVVEYIQYIPYNEPENQYSFTKRFYNEIDKLVKKVEFDRDTSYTKETRYLYDSTGNLTEERQSTHINLTNGGDFDFLGYVKKYNYNSAGKISDISSYYSSGLLESKVIVTYNDSGKRSQACKYNSEGNPVDKLIYNDDCNITEHFIYNSDGDLKEKDTAIYDRKGHVIETCKYDSNGEMFAREQTLYKRNTPVEIHRFSKNELTEKVISNYTNGKLVEQITYLGNGDVESVMIFEYDEMGNMITRKLYEGNIKKPSELTTWDIKYR